MCVCVLVCGKGVGVRLGVGCPCPPVRNDIVTRYLFLGNCALSFVNIFCPSAFPSIRPSLSVAPHKNSRKSWQRMCINLRWIVFFGNILIMTNPNIHFSHSQKPKKRVHRRKKTKSSISENSKSLKSEHAPAANLLLNLDIIQIKVYFIIVYFFSHECSKSHSKVYASVFSRGHAILHLAVSVFRFLCP